MFYLCLEPQFAGPINNKMFLLTLWKEMWREGSGEKLDKLYILSGVLFENDKQTITVRPNVRDDNNSWTVSLT